MALVIITPPEADPITLAEAKAHLRVNFDDDDAQITAMVRAATLAIQNRCDRTLMPTTYDLIYDTWPVCNDPPGAIEIPRPPLLSVESVNYIDADGTEQELDPSGYEVDTASLKGWVVPISPGWPAIKNTINAVRIRFVAGYASESPNDVTVPEPIIMAIKLMLTDLYDVHGTFVTGTVLNQVPDAVRSLLLDYELITV